MQHVLDNPAWNALNSGNQQFAFGNEAVKYFDREVSPFVGFDENTGEHFGMLHEMLPGNGPALFVSTTSTVIPEMWKVIKTIPGLQMVHDADGHGNTASPELMPLTYEHVPQMLELTKLTNPGPFSERTIEFGHYLGIFDDSKLVAMAGQRLQPFDFAEISAVCTHPEYTGKGYAGQLMSAQAGRMRGKGLTPYLHVRGDNFRAIELYKRLGFTVRSDVWFYVLMKR